MHVMLTTAKEALWNFQWTAQNSIAFISKAQDTSAKRALSAYRTTLQEELSIREPKRKRIVMRSVRRCCLVLKSIRISTMPRNSLKIRISRNSFRGEGDKNMQTVQHVVNAMSICLETTHGANGRLLHVPFWRRILF